MSLKYLDLLLLLLSLWFYISVIFSLTSQDITNFSIIKNILYYHNCFYKLLRITLSIVNRKADRFKMSIVTIAIAIIVVIYFHQQT